MGYSLVKDMEGKDKLLSVIVAIYNVEPYLERCIKSLVGQSYSNLEIILVDDGSPDNCPAMCDEWAKRDSRIKVIHKQNGGLGFARNSGLEIATGDYVAFVDSDDWLETEMYQQLMEEAIENDVDCVYCGFRQQLPSLKFVDVIDMDNTLIREDGISELSGRFLMDFSRNHLHFSVWHGVYRRSLIDFKFVSERDYVSEDYVFTHTFMRRCHSFAYVPMALYNYMFNSNSLSRNYNEHTFNRVLATATSINEIYSGTEYDGAGNTYAFCQVYFLMRFPLMKAKLSFKKRYQIFKNMILDGRYNSMLQRSELFRFQTGLKYKIIKMVYKFQRRQMVKLNYMAIRLISLKKG